MKYMVEMLLSIRQHFFLLHVILIINFTMNPLSLAYNEWGLGLSLGLGLGVYNEDQTQTQTQTQTLCTMS